MKRHRSLHAAAVLSPTRFCVAVTERDEDDPFTVLLTHEVGRDRPWTRYDLNDAVVSIAAEWHPNGSGRYAALTRNGEVVFVEGDIVRVETIPGAGLPDDGHPGRGRVSRIAAIGGTLFVTGESSQVYQRTGENRWVDVGGPALRPEPGYDSVAFRSVGGWNADSLFVCGYADPTSKELTAQNLAEIKEAGRRGDFERAKAIYDSVSDPNNVIKGRAFAWDGRAWQRVAADATDTFFDVCCLPDHGAILAGFGGLLLRAQLGGSFAPVDAAGLSDTILSATSHNGDLVLATENDLLRVAGTTVRSISPVRGRSKSLKVEAAGPVLYYFDYDRGVFRLAEGRWSTVPIPDGATAR